MPRLGIGIFLLFISGTLVFFFIMPRWEAAGVLRGEVKELEAVSQELIELAAKRDALLAQYNAVPESDLVKLQELAPVGKQSAKTLVDFEDLARIHEVALEQVEFAVNQNETGAVGGAVHQFYQPLPVSLTVRGDYSSFRNFLTGLEGNLRMFDVTDINFSGGAELSATLRGKIYYQP